MKPAYFAIIAAMPFFFPSCSKTDGPNPLPVNDSIAPIGYKAYVNKVTGAGDQSTVVYFQCIYGVDNSVTYIGGGYSLLNFSYSGTQSINMFRYTEAPTSARTEYTIVYDSANQPQWGIRTVIAGEPPYSGPSRAPSSATIFLDSIRYKTVGGNITEIRFFDRRSATSHYPNFPSSTGAYLDTTLTIAGTLETYQLSYLNDNITKIHSEDRAGKIIDREYTYGTKKGMMYDIRLSPMIAPDLILQYPSLGLGMLFSFSKNDLLLIKNTFVSENNRTETTSLAYTYNKYEYPVALILSGPTTSTTSLTGNKTMIITYK